MRCFPLSATCQGSHRDAEAALEYLDPLDENDGAGVISDDDGSAISLPSDGGLEISFTEGESEAKSRDGKSLTMRMTTAIIRCAFLEVHLEEEMFAEFGDEDDLEGVEDESVEQEGALWEGLGEEEVEQKVEEDALVAETLLTGTQPALAFNNDAQPLTWDVVIPGESEPRESSRLFHWENSMPISHDIVNLKGNSTF